MPRARVGAGAPRLHLARPPPRVKDEPFFLARFDGSAEVRPAAFTEAEHDAYAGHAWLTRAELADLTDLEPPNFLEAVAPLPPWTGSGG